MAKWARWLSAETADSEGVDSCRLLSDCTPYSWSASLALKEERASAFPCFPSSSGQQNGGANCTEGEWSQGRDGAPQAPVHSSLPNIHGALILDLEL